MRSSILLVIVVCLLAACVPGGTAIPPVTTVASSPEPTPISTSLPPTPTSEPADTPLPPTPTLPARADMWWDDTVFYEVFVRSFSDSDSDGIGDFQGIIDKLDYFQDLGVTGLWLMPIFDSPSYHGYDVVDYLTTNPEYGSPDDFQRLVAGARQRDMRVIVDLILNHTSDQHPWFQDSASGPDSELRDWYIWSETDPGFRGPWDQQVWHSKNGAYYYGLFWDGMPDLNLENDSATAELYEVARYWLEEMGVDGFRLDAARHFVEEGDVQAHTPATHQWLGEFYAHTKAANPESLTVAEIWDVSELVAPYVGQEVDLAFEFSLAKAILESVNEGRVTPVASAMKEVQRLYPPRGHASFLANHDQNRVMDVMTRDPAKAKLAASLLLTLPGVPFLYYGEEIGMTGSKPDERIRTPMQWTSAPNAGFTLGTPWQPVNEGYEGLNVEAQTLDPDSLLNHYRALISLRNEHRALSMGDYVQVQSADSKVYAFLRLHEDERLLVVANMRPTPVTDYALSLRKSPLPAGDYEVVDLLSGIETAPLKVEEDGTFEGYLPLPELPAQSTLILELVSRGANKPTVVESGWVIL